MIVLYRQEKSYDAIINNSGPNHPIIVSYFDLYNCKVSYLTYNFTNSLQLSVKTLGLQFSFLSDGFKLNFWLFLWNMTVHPVRLEE